MHGENSNCTRKRNDGEKMVVTGLTTAWHRYVRLVDKENKRSPIHHGHVEEEEKYDAVQFVTSLVRVF